MSPAGQPKVNFQWRLCSKTARSGTGTQCALAGIDSDIKIKWYRRRTWPSKTIWMASGGVKSGIAHDQTDILGYGVIEQTVYVHDLQATILNLMGLDHTRWTIRFRGRDIRLTDVHGNVVHKIIS